MVISQLQEQIEKLLTYYPNRETWEEFCNEIDNLTDSNEISSIIDFSLAILEKNWPVALRIMPPEWKGTKKEVLAPCKLLIDFDAYLNLGNPYNEPDFESLSCEEQGDLILDFIENTLDIGRITAFDLSWNEEILVVACKMSEKRQNRTYIIKHDFRADKTLTISEFDEEWEDVVLSRNGRFIGLANDDKLIVFQDKKMIFSHLFSRNIETDEKYVFQPCRTVLFSEDERLLVYIHPFEGKMTVVDLLSGEICCQKIFSRPIYSLVIHPQDNTVIVVDKKPSIYSPTSLENLSELKDQYNKEDLWFSGPGAYNELYSVFDRLGKLFGTVEPLEPCLYDPNSCFNYYGGISFYEKSNNGWQTWNYLFDDVVHEPIKLVRREGGLTACYSTGYDMIIIEYPEKTKTKLETGSLQKWKFSTQSRNIIFAVDDKLYKMSYAND